MRTAIRRFRVRVPGGVPQKTQPRLPVHRPNPFRPAWGIEGYRRVMGESWLQLLQRRVHDGWVAVVAWVKRFGKSWSDLDDKFPGMFGERPPHPARRCGTDLVG